MELNEAAVNVRKLSQRYAYASIKMHEAIARKAGFSGTDHKYLGFFLQKGEMTAGQLAELTGLTTGAVTGLIDRFEKRGLVRRIHDEADRRKVMIVPAIEKITALIVPLYEHFQAKSDQLFGSFSAKEIKTIERYLLQALTLAEQTTAAMIP